MTGTEHRGGQEFVDVSVLYSDHLKSIHFPETCLWCPGNKIQCLSPPFYLFSTELCKIYPSSLGCVDLLCMCVCVYVEKSSGWMVEQGFINGILAWKFNRLKSRFMDFATEETPSIWTYFVLGLEVMPAPCSLMERLRFQDVINVTPMELV